MSKNDEFILTEKFDKALSRVGKTNYSTTQSKLEKLAQKSIEILDDKNEKETRIAL